MQRDRGKVLNPFNGVLALVVGCVIFFVIFGRQAAERMLFQPPATSYELDESFLTVESADGVSLNVFWAESSKNRWTVFYFYGSDEDIGLAMPRLRSYQLRGFNVVCFDYRGYGHTAGKPSEPVLYRDAEAVYSYIIEEKGIPESKIVLHGRSLGAGVAIELAVRRSPARLIVESTFRSAYKAVLPLNWVPGDSFENEEKAELTTCTVLLIHGDEDELFDVGNSLVLREAFGEDRSMLYRVAGAGHHNVAKLGGIAYWRTVEQFIREPK